MSKTQEQKEFEEFEKRWEEFRLSRGIPSESFVAEGYGFVEHLEDFTKKENELLRKELKEKEEENETMFYCNEQREDALNCEIDILKNNVLDMGKLDDTFCGNCRFRLSMYVAPMGCILFNKEEKDMKKTKIKVGRFLQHRVDECIGAFGPEKKHEDKEDGL